MIALLKPEKRSTTKARKARAEAAVKQAVRAQCVERDGYCRISRFTARKRDGDRRSWVNPYDHPCSGPSEWAHLGEQKRFKTRR